MNEDFTPIEGTTNFFVGHIDEVRTMLSGVVVKIHPFACHL